MNIELAVHDDIEGIAATVVLMDDLLAVFVLQQAQLRANLLAIVVAPVSGHFEVELKLKMPVVLLDQFREDVHLLDGVQNSLMFCDFLRHSVYRLLKSTPPGATPFQGCC